jgi:DNA primase catalytic subunit
MEEKRRTIVRYIQLKGVKKDENEESRKRRLERETRKTRQMTIGEETFRTTHRK